MTENVEITISGLQWENEGDGVETAIRTRGQYYLRNGSHYMLFEEQHQDFDGVCKTRIKIKNGQVELTRQGLIRTQMLFEENQKHLTNYAMPFGDLELGIHTKKILLNEQDHSMQIHVEYSLEVNGEYLAEQTIDIDIRSLS